MASCFVWFLLITTTFASKRKFPSPEEIRATLRGRSDRILIALRGDGDGLIVQTDDDDAQIILPLDSNSIPLYISWSILTNEIYINDRANKQLFVYDTLQYRRKHVIPIDCNGIFHQSVNMINQLWIVCDIDKTILIIDVATKQPITTINIDLKGIGSEFKPHDIYSSTFYGFVSLLSTNSDVNIGWILKYSTTTFCELGRLKVGGDPHVNNDFLQQHPNYLYAASQGDGKVYKIDAHTFVIEATLDVPNAHGIQSNNRLLGVMDITDNDGIGSLYGIDLATFQLLPVVYDLIAPNPHNLMTDFIGTKFYVTHSAPGKVTAYDLDLETLILSNPRIIFDGEGSNPFGIMLAVDDQCKTKDKGGYRSKYRNGYRSDHGQRSGIYDGGNSRYYALQQQSVKDDMNNLDVESDIDSKYRYLYEIFGVVSFVNIMICMGCYCRNRNKQKLSNSELHKYTKTDVDDSDIEQN